MNRRSQTASISFTIIYLIGWILPSLTKVPEDLLPINIYDQADTSNYSVFRGLSGNATNSTSNKLYQFQGMKRDGDNYYIYGRENIFVVDVDASVSSSHEIFFKQDVEWKANKKDVALCIRKGQSREKCRSFIKLFQIDANDENRADKRVIVCSTNAYNPVCRIYDILMGGDLKLSNESLSVNLLCPHDPNETTASIITDGNLYSATVSGFSKQDPLIFRSSRTSSLVNLRTPRAETPVLNDPHFFRFVDPGLPLKKVYIFFTETAIEERTHKLVTRVGQACKNDQGGNNLLRNQFSSFFKARLNCSLPGQPVFYFDEMSDVTDFSVLNSWYKTENKKMVFAIMNTPKNSVPASAICAFTLDDVENAMLGPFREKYTREKSGEVYWEKQDEYPKPHLSKCNRFPSQINDNNLSFIRKHPLMYNSVASWNFGKTGPLYTRTNSRNFLTSLAVDTEAGLSAKFTVLLAGTEDGKIVKVLILNTTEVISIEERAVFNEEKCEGDRKVLKIVLDNASATMMVAFENCVIRAPLCPLIGHKCERKCLQSRDPYCAWQNGNCVSVNIAQVRDRTRARKSPKQDIFHEASNLLPPCADPETGTKELNSSTLVKKEITKSFNHSVVATGTKNEQVVLDKDRVKEETPVYIYILVGVVCLIFGFTIGLCVCVLKKRLPFFKQMKSAEKIHQGNAEKKTDSIDRRGSLYLSKSRDRRGSNTSQFNRRHSNPRASLLMVDPKRKRTLTETSGRSEDGAVLYQVNPAGNDALRPDRAKQIFSTSSGVENKRRTRCSKPSATSDAGRTDEMSACSEVHPSPSSDPQYDDPFSDDAEPAERPRSAENLLEPHMIPAPNAASSRAPPLRSMSLHGQHPMHRTYSMGNKGAYSTVDPSRPNPRGRNRQLSLQIPNGNPLLCYQQPNMQLPTPPVSGSPKHFAWVKQGQGEQNPTPGKIMDPGRMTDYTHSLDRRRKLNGLNYSIPLSESYDEHRNPMFPSAAFPGRKRIVSESEKNVRTPMSRPPQHHAIHEEEEVFVDTSKACPEARFMRSRLKLHIPQNTQSLMNHQTEPGRSPPVVKFANAPFPTRSGFSQRVLDHSTPITPVRDFSRGGDPDPSVHFIPPQRNFPEHINQECDPLIPRSPGSSVLISSSPRTDVSQPIFPTDERYRHLSGSSAPQQTVPASNRMSVPVSLTMNTPNFQAGDQPRVRRISGGITPRIPHSPSENGITTDSDINARAHSPAEVISVIYT